MISEQIGAMLHAKRSGRYLRAESGRTLGWLAPVLGALALSAGACSVRAKPVRIPEAPRFQAKSASWPVSPVTEGLRKAPPLVEMVVRAAPTPNLHGKYLTLLQPGMGDQLLGMNMDSLGGFARMVGFGEATETVKKATKVSGIFEARIGLELLRLGYTRYVDAQALKSIKAVHQVQDSEAELTMEASLDRMAFVSHIPRVDYILVLHRVEVTEHEGEVDVPLHVDRTAAIQYFKSMTAIRKSWILQDRRIGNQRKRFVKDVNSAIRTLETRGATDTQPAEGKSRALYDQRMHALQLRHRTVRQADAAKLTLGPRPPSASEVKQALSVKTKKVLSRLFFVKADFSIMDASSGETLAAFRYTKGSKTAQQAIATIIKAMAQRTMERTIVPPIQKAPVLVTEAGEE